jgi:hypothetical protein
MAFRFRLYPVLRMIIISPSSGAVKRKMARVFGRSGRGSANP